MEVATAMPIKRAGSHIWGCCLLLLAMALPAFALDISGKWQFTVETDAGGGSPTFVFKQDGEKLTGTYNGLFGSAPLTGTVKGEVIEFSFEAAVQDQKGKIVYTGRIQSGTKMAGDVDLAGLAKGKWTGAKTE
jgi:hypothetical protein